LNETDDIPDHGGRRAGAGRPAGNRSDPAVLQKYRAARTRNEKAKADLAALKLRNMLGAYVERSAVIQAAATTQDLLAHALLPLSAKLTGQGVPAWACAMVSQAVEVELANVAATLAEVAGPEPVTLESER
jgi:hypothetical protein